MDTVRYRVGADIGGTFTDVAILGSDGSIATAKVSSTPEDYGVAIIDGVMRLMQQRGLDASDVEGVVHGTTVATNAILQRKGARTALITTAGFRDVLELARLRYSKLYDVNFVKAKPLVSRRLRFVVDERMGPRGEIRKPLDEENARAIIERVRAADVEALAICLLHSYANPDHERRLAEIAREILPPHVFVTCSVDVLPELREYERTSTTVINGYLGPVVADYIASLCEKLKGIGIGAPLQIMQSNGGILYADAVLRKPAAIVESGPAAGVIGAAQIAPLSGYPNVISLDMGGTTAKASMVEDGAVVKTSDFEVGAGINLSSKLAMGGGHALKLPVIDVSEIGAGGGSIVAVDRHGRLQVGPESAGAGPGPVCYDTGGERATLTDALVALGYLNSAYASAVRRGGGQAGHAVVEHPEPRRRPADPARAAAGEHHAQERRFRAPPRAGPGRLREPPGARPRAGPGRRARREAQHRLRAARVRRGHRPRYAEHGCRGDRRAAEAVGGRPRWIGRQSKPRRALRAKTRPRSSGFAGGLTRDSRHAARWMSAIPNVVVDPVFR